jgi:Protein of unknown function (DUF3108)
LDCLWQLAKIDFRMSFRFPFLLKQSTLHAFRKNTTCGNRGCHSFIEPATQGTRGSNRRAILASAIVLALGLLSLASARETLAGPPAQTKSHQPVPARAVPPAKELPPFRVGEKLDYDVAWSSFPSAASVELAIPEQRDLYGWQTWHFRATAHTVSPVRTLFPIDDEFDSYTDAATRESRLYQNYLDELGRKVDQTWQFIPEGQIPRAPGPAVIVLPGTRDPLGAFYELRGIDWQSESEASAPVYDGRHLYEMRASKEASGEAVEVPAGKFSTTQIGIQVFEQNQQVPSVHFTVWLANNSARTPVLMQAEMPFGTLRIEMVASSTP